MIAQVESKKLNKKMYISIWQQHNRMVGYRNKYNISCRAKQSQYIYIYIKVSKILNICISTLVLKNIYIQEKTYNIYRNHTVYACRMGLESKSMGTPHNKD